MLDAKQKLQDSFSEKINEVSELNQIEAKLMETVNSLYGEIESDLVIKNENISKELSQLQSDNEKLTLEISDKKHGSIFNLTFS